MQEIGTVLEVGGKATPKDCLPSRAASGAKHISDSHVGIASNTCRELVTSGDTLLEYIGKGGDTHPRIIYAFRYQLRVPVLG